MRSVHQETGILVYDNPLNDIVECDYCFGRIKPDEDWKENFSDDNKVFFYHELCAQYAKGIQ